MPSRNRVAAAALLVIAAPALAQTTPDGPPTIVDKASERPAPYDQVGYAIIGPEGAPAAAHPTLPIGSHAEVTALDTGRTVLVAITATSRPGREIELSPAAAQELGMTPGRPVAVRVRTAAASPTDLVGFTAGKAAIGRPDAPPVLLTALKRKLAGMPLPGPAAAAPVAKPSPGRPATPRPTAPKPAPVAAGPGYYVQIAALSDPTRAASVARAVGGQVSSAGRLHRVRLGPYPDQRAAQAARDAVAGRGYGDARIVRE